MSAYIYIIKDADKTKIGISTNLDRRLPAYKTHNPNHQVYKTYPCSIEEAKRIELVIKQAFKDKLTGQGKEWFSVPAEEVDKYVCSLLDALPTTSDAMPSLHGVKLTQKAEVLLNSIYEAVEGRKDSLSLKEQFAELFGKAFSLGIPYHKLPDNLMAKEYLYVDLMHSANPHDSKLVREAVTGVQKMTHDDHCWYYFHLLKLSSGHSIAVCTAKVSMPYIERIVGDAEKEIFEHSKELGLWATFHHDWSWWYPTKTALILYQPKTPVSKMARQWDKSFRKWVMERKEVLKFEDYEDMETLQRAIEDVCDDKHFPLEFKDYSDLQEKYLGPFWHFLNDEQMQDHDYEDDRALAMKFLVGLWRNNHINPSN